MAKHKKHKSLERKKEEKEIKGGKKEKKARKNRKEVEEKKTKGIKETNKTRLVLTLTTGLVIIFLMIFGIKWMHSINPTNGITTGKAVVDLYVMSMCPYGNQAIHGLVPAVKELKDVDLRLHFIAEETNGKFSSLHGQDEVDEDKRQVCIIKYYPKKWMDYIECIANKYLETKYQPPKNYWKECAKKNGINIDKVKKCAEGDEGTELLKENIKDANSKGIGASPTIFVNGEEYYGGRDKESFISGICLAVNKTISGCENVTEPESVLLTVLNDKRCKDCDVTGILNQLKSIVPKMEVKEIDYKDKGGKELYDKLGIKYLPALVFNASITKNPGYSILKKYLLTMPNNNYLLRIGASFDPTREICNNNEDDDEDGKIDCDDDECKDSAFCKYNFSNNNPTAQFFIMSYCPFGLQFLKAILPVWEKFKEENAPANIELRFVSYTMHGDKEEEENKRMTCIREEQPKKLIDYLKCYVEAGESDKCLEKAKVNKQELEDCMNNRYEKYFAVDKQLNDDYGVRGSPTFVLNGEVTRVSRSPEAIKEVICGLYDKDKKPSVCDENFSDKAASPGFGWDTTENSDSNAQCG